jgi:hypothetical protein
MGNKALDLATTMVLRDTKPGRTCPIPVNFEGVGGLKVIDHCDCGGCYFEGEDCPNIDNNLLCSCNGKTVVYMPVPADEMGVNVSGTLSRMAAEESEAPIDRIDEIQDALEALTCATHEFKHAKDAFETASKWYAETRNNWTAAWNNVASFARSTMSDVAPVPVSIPTVQAEPTAKIPEVTITVSPNTTELRFHTDVASAERKRPVLRSTNSGKVSAEEVTLATLDFDNPMTVADIAEATGRGRSSIGNAMTRLMGCGLVSRARVANNPGYVLNDATNPPVVAPNSIEMEVVKILRDAGTSSVTPEYVAPKMNRYVDSTAWIMIVMWRAGLLERDDEGFYSLADGME